MVESGNDERVLVTVTMTRAQLRALKRAAREADTTVSALVRGWAEAESAADGTLAYGAEHAATVPVEAT